MQIDSQSIGHDQSPSSGQMDSNCSRVLTRITQLCHLLTLSGRVMMKGFFILTTLSAISATTRSKTKTNFYISRIGHCSHRFQSLMEFGHYVKNPPNDKSNPVFSQVNQLAMPCKSLVVIVLHIGFTPRSHSHKQLMTRNTKVEWVYHIV